MIDIKPNRQALEIDGQKNSSSITLAIKKIILIKELNDNNKILTHEANKQAHVNNYYTKLYIRDDKVETNDAAQLNYFTSICCKATKEQNLKLTTIPSLQELQEAIKDLPTEKAIRVNSVSIKKNYKLFDNIKEDLLTLIIEVIYT